MKRESAEFIQDGVVAIAVIIQLKGGLGNQLFQYATGRKLSILLDMPLFFDTVTGFENDFYDRKYSLDAFNIAGEVIPQEDLFRIRNRIKPGFLNRCIAFAGKYRPQALYELFAPKVLPMGKSSLIGSNFMYLHGYWQNESYFSDIRQVLLKELTLKAPPSGRNPGVIEEMKATNSLAVHFRRQFSYSRGRRDSLCTLVPCSDEYYKNALEYMAGLYDDLNIFVFADDIGLVRESFDFGRPVRFIDYNDSEFDDFRLISSCKHQITANSSFSWWAAWLNPDPEKVVIGPKRWFSNVADPEWVHPALPDSWVVL
jgi:hypothetical protein